MQQVIEAVEAGADYIVFPSLDIDVIKKTNALGRISISRAFTPSEIVNVYHAGADIVKLFPAETLGMEYIKANTAPLNHTPFILTFSACTYDSKIILTKHFLPIFNTSPSVKID